MAPTSGDQQARPRGPLGVLRGPGLSCRCPHVGPQGGGREMRTAQDYKSHSASGSGAREGGGAFRCPRPRRLPPGSARGSAMELAEPGGESLRGDRAHPAAPGPGWRPLVPPRVRRCPTAAPGGGKMGGVMEELGVGRAKPRIPGRDPGSACGLGLERLPEEARSRAATGWAFRRLEGPLWVGGWHPLEAPNCQRAETDVWCGEALGSSPLPRMAFG